MPVPEAASGITFTRVRVHHDSGKIVSVVCNVSLCSFSRYWFPDFEFHGLGSFGGVHPILYHGIAAVDKMIGHGGVSWHNSKLFEINDRVVIQTADALSSHLVICHHQTFARLFAVGNFASIVVSMHW